MKRFEVVTISLMAAGVLALGQAPQDNAPPSDPPGDGVPFQLTVKAGTFVTVRVDQPLSSDHNQQGDAFWATLVQPLVVDGVVIAQRGQTIGGRVTEAQKAGRVEGVAKLGIQLTELTLVDGQQVPVQTELISRRGPTSTGQDAGSSSSTPRIFSTSSHRSGPIAARSRRR
jgi:hypothetical protein